MYTCDYCQDEYNYVCIINDFYYCKYCYCRDQNLYNIVDVVWFQ